MSAGKDLSNKFRFFIKSVDLSKDLLAIYDLKIINQWRKVLRIKEGDSVILLDGQGRSRLFLLANYRKNSVEIEASAKLIKEKLTESKVYLYLSLLKKENFELVVQKAVEVGILGIFPVVSERVVKTGWRNDRVMKIATEALEQSGRLWLPTISEPINFEDALEQSTNLGQTILFDPGGFDIKDYKKDKNSKRLNIFIGPEGGFSDEELNRAKELSVLIMSLTKRATLRAETASIVASYWAVNLSDDI